jgi:hypothetical protein
MPLNGPCRWDGEPAKLGGDLRAFADPRAGGGFALEAAIRSGPQRRVGQVLGMPRQMDLAITADDPRLAVDQDRRVVAVELAVFLGQLSRAEVKADPSSRARSYPRHLGSILLRNKRSRSSIYKNENCALNWARYDAFAEHA